MLKSRPLLLRAIKSNGLDFNICHEGAKPLFCSSPSRWPNNSENCRAECGLVHFKGKGEEAFIDLVHLCVKKVRHCWRVLESGSTIRLLWLKPLGLCYISALKCETLRRWYPPPLMTLSYMLPLTWHLLQLVQQDKLPTCYSSPHH